VRKLFSDGVERVLSEMLFHAHVAEAARVRSPSGMTWS